MPRANLKDLSTTEDITRVITKFYDELLLHPLTEPIFRDLNMADHMPRIIAFWENMLFGGGRYNGSPFDRQVPLDLKKEHFEVWYETFCLVLNELFAGPKASLMKQRTHSISFIFSQKLGLAPPNIQLGI